MTVDNTESPVPPDNTKISENKKSSNTNDSESQSVSGSGPALSTASIAQQQSQSKSQSAAAPVTTMAAAAAESSSSEKNIAAVASSKSQTVGPETGPGTSGTKTKSGSGSSNHNVTENVNQYSNSNQVQTQNQIQQQQYSESELQQQANINSELRQQIIDLRQQLNLYIDHYNDEVSRLETFKMLIQSQIRGEATKLSRVENEKNDLLYQGLDDEQKSTVLQQRLGDVLEELRSLAEITNEQDLALEFLLSKKIPKMEEFIRENVSEKKADEFLTEMNNLKDAPILSKKDLSDGSDNNSDAKSA